MALAPKFTRKDLPVNLQDPATRFIPIEPSEDYLEKPLRALYVGFEGSVSLEDMEGNIATFRNVPSGSTIVAVIVRVLPFHEGVSSISAGLVGLR